MSEIDMKGWKGKVDESKPILDLNKHSHSIPFYYLHLDVQPLWLRLRTRPSSE